MTRKTSVLIPTMTGVPTNLGDTYVTGRIGITALPSPTDPHCGHVSLSAAKSAPQAAHVDMVAIVSNSNMRFLLHCLLGTHPIHEDHHYCNPYDRQPVLVPSRRRK